MCGESMQEMEATATTPHQQPSPPVVGTAPGRTNLGQTNYKPNNSIQEQDAQYMQYLTRLRSSTSSLSQRFITATDLALEAFNTINQDPKQANTAASLLRDAYMTDERATSKVMKHICFQISGEYVTRPLILQYLSPMIESLPNEDCLAGNIIIYWLCKSMGKPPSELLQYLDKCTFNINQHQSGYANMTCGSNHATILVLKALEFTAMGRSRKARSLMIKAAKVGHGYMSGWTALWNLCCIKQTGCSLETMSPDTIAQDVEDLIFLLSKMKKEDRYTLGLLMRLCNIYVICGNLTEANKYRNQMKSTIDASRKLHPPLDRAPIEGREFYNSLFKLIDEGKQVPIVQELKSALELGVIDHKSFKMNFDVSEFSGGEKNTKKRSEMNDPNSPALLNLDVCIVCGSQAKMKCAECKCVQYCGREHQKIHWKSEHKAMCQAMKLVNKGVKVKVNKTKS